MCVCGLLEGGTEEVMFAAFQFSACAAKMGAADFGGLNVGRKYGIICDDS